MGDLSPIIKAISALAWDGAPPAADVPARFDCHLEIGAAGEDRVDYFNLTVVTPAWARAHSDAASQETGPETGPLWLPPRAILRLAAPSFEAISDCVAAEIAANGPYPSWPDVAQRLRPYLRWDLEGVLYPPFN